MSNDTINNFMHNLVNPMIEKIEGVFYTRIDEVYTKCVDIRFKGNKAVANLETYRHYWNCTFLILQEQKEYLFKKFAVENPSTFGELADYLESHNLHYKVISHRVKFGES